MKRQPVTFSLVDRSANGPPVKLSMEELITAQLEQYSKMLTCDDPVLQVQGRQKLREIAGILASAENQRLARKVFNPLRAALPRPGARSELRQRIVQAMEHGRRDQQSLKEFLSRWQTDPIDGLRLTFDRESDKYLVDDENQDSTSDEYALSTLKKMYSGG